MANEKLCLRLNSFETNIRTTWQELLHDEKFCDMTLACDDKQIQAHKIVISSSSPVLGNILKSNSNPHPFIYLRGVKFEDLFNLVNFMYQGEVNIEEDNLDRFLSTAEDLQVKGLSEQNKEAYNLESNKNEMDTCAKRIGLKDKHDIESENENFKGQIIINMEENISPENRLVESKHNLESYKNEMDTCAKRMGLKDKHDIESENENFWGQVIVNMEENISPENRLLESKHNVVSLNGNCSFSCEQCEKSFTQKHSLNKHIASAHEGVQYPCVKCDYKATTKGNLKDHIGAVHEGIRYPCSQCEFTATFKHSVNRHVKKCHQ